MYVSLSLIFIGIKCNLCVNNLSYLNPLFLSQQPIWPYQYTNYCNELLFEINKVQNQYTIRFILQYFLYTYSTLKCKNLTLNRVAKQKVFAQNFPLPFFLSDCKRRSFHFTNSFFCMIFAVIFCALPLTQLILNKTM